MNNLIESKIASGIEANSEKMKEELEEQCRIQEEKCRKTLQEYTERFSRIKQEALGELERRKQESLGEHPDSTLWTQAVEILYSRTWKEIEENFNHLTGDVTNFLEFYLEVAKEFLKDEEELREKSREIDKLREELAAKPSITTVPKYKELLGNLVSLSEERLSAKLGLGRNVPDVKGVLDEIEIKLNSYLFGVMGVEKRDRMDKDDKEIFDEVYNIGRLLESKLEAGEYNLTEADEKLLKKICNKLPLYAKKRMEDQKSI